MQRTFDVNTLSDCILDRCRLERPSANRQIFVLGRVETPYRAPVAKARVTIASSIPDAPADITPFFEYTTGSDGVFQACLGDGFRRVPVTIWARVLPASATAFRTLNETVTLVHLVRNPPHTP